MAWSEIRVQPDSAFGSLDWWAIVAELRCDPYLVWADLSLRLPLEITNRDPFADYVPVLIELDAATRAPADLLLFPTHFRAYGRSRFVSALIPAMHLCLLLKAGPLKGNQSHAPVRRFEYIGARNGSSREDPDPELKTFTSETPLTAVGAAGGRYPTMEIKPLSDARRNFQRRRSEQQGRLPERESVKRHYHARLPRQLSHPLLCIIDDGFGFLDRRLWDESRIVVRGVLDLRSKADETGSVRDSLQALTKSSPRTAEVDLGIGPGFDQWDNGTSFRGTLLGRHLDLVSQHAAAAGGEEASLMAAFEAFGLRRRWTHGSAVLGQMLDALEAGDPTAAPLLLAQLPGASIEDTSGGSLSGVVLDAIHDALDIWEDETEESRQTGNGQPSGPLIVNLSYGHFGGPHDGSSMFEAALDELMADHPHLHVVVPAGNSHLLRAHASGRLDAQGSRLDWRVLPANPGDSYLELWFEDPDQAQITVTPPGGTSLTLARGQAWVWSSPDNAVLHAAAIFPARVPQGERGGMLLLAVAPTDGRLRADPPLVSDGSPVRRRAQGPHGVWTIEVRTRDGRRDGGRFDAWAQRGDVAPGRRRASIGLISRQSHFLDPAARSDSPARPIGPDPSATLNGIGTLYRPGQFFVVGSGRRCDGGLSTYSAAGPGRDPAGARICGPDWVAPGDESLALPGLMSSGLLGSSRVRVGGSSMAAAVFSARLYREACSGRPPSCLRFNPVDIPTRGPKVAAGGPAHAEPPLLRGECQRVEPYEFALGQAAQCRDCAQPLRACLAATTAAAACPAPPTPSRPGGPGTPPVPAPSAGGSPSSDQRRSCPPGPGASGAAK